jgi:hypothetical protein
MLDHMQSDLFSEGGASPTLPWGQSVATRFRECGRRASLVMLVNNNTRPARAHHYEAKQLCLDLRQPDNVVVRLVPRTRSTFLGMRATSFFRRTPALQRFASRYRRHGVIFLGDLLRLPAQDVLRALRRPEWIRQLEEELANVGLVLGDRFSWWKRPVPY